MNMYLHHKPYDEVEQFTWHDARAVLLNARQYLLPNVQDEADYDAFNLLGRAFDKVGARKVSNPNSAATSGRR